MTSSTDDGSGAPTGSLAGGEGRASSVDRAPEGVRLQKVLASAGVASRRVSEELITAGRVRVNGEVVRELGRRIDPETDKVAVDNTAVQLDTTKRYVMLNKPVGIVSSLADQHGRPDLSRFTAQFEERLFNVGRLDAETSGLLILTNDGELAHVLAHPSFGVMKTYIARVEGRVSPQTISRLTKGVELDDGPIVADRARLLDSSGGAGRSGGSSLVEVTLHSGRNRIVRRMLEEVGHPVVELVRRQFGPLHLGTLAAGELRDLNRDELGALLTLSRAAKSPAAESAGRATKSAASRGSKEGGDAARRDVEHADTADAKPAKSAHDRAKAAAAERRVPTTGARASAASKTSASKTSAPKSAAPASGASKSAGAQAKGGDRG